MPGTYRRRETAVRRDVAGQTLLVPIQGGIAELERIFSLNAVGKCLWELLAESRTEAQLVEAVCGRFDVEEDQARSDTRSFLGELLRAGLADKS